MLLSRPNISLFDFCCFVFLRVLSSLHTFLNCYVFPFIFAVFYSFIRTLSQVGESKTILMTATVRHLKFKNNNFGHVTVIGFNIYSTLPYFIKIGQFLPRDACIKHGLCRHAVSVCLSVYVSVCLSRSYILSKRVNISSDFFRHRVEPSF